MELLTAKLSAACMSQSQNLRLSTFHDLHIQRSNWLPAMLSRTLSPTLRGALRQRPLAAASIARRAYAARELPITDNPIPPTDPQKREVQSNVAATNEMATTSAGSHDAVLQEKIADGEEKRRMQAPNRERTWSTNQMPRELAMAGPRFEQMIMEDQVCGSHTVLVETLCSLRQKGSMGEKMMG